MARGESNSQSDVDFLVEMQEGVSLFGVAGFCYDSEQLLGINVDVVPLSVVNQVEDQDFARNIQREAISYMKTVSEHLEDMLDAVIS